MAISSIQNSNNHISQNIENIHIKQTSSDWKKALLVFGGCMATSFAIDKIIPRHMSGTGNPLLQLLAMCGIIAGMGSIISSMFLIRSIFPNDTYNDAIAMKHGKSIFTNTDIQSISEPQNMIAKNQSHTLQNKDFKQKEKDLKPVDISANDDSEEYITKPLYKSLGLELSKN